MDGVSCGQIFKGEFGACVFGIGCYNIGKETLRGDLREKAVL